MTPVGNMLKLFTSSLLLLMLRNKLVCFCGLPFQSSYMVEINTH